MMTDADFEEFMNAFRDFIHHAEEFEYRADAVQSHLMHSQEVIQEIESKASDLGVTCDYYAMEFM